MFVQLFVPRRPQPEDDVYQNTENAYEYIATPDGDKKKVKTKVKKRKEPKSKKLFILEK